MKMEAWVVDIEIAKMRPSVSGLARQERQAPFSSAKQEEHLQYQLVDNQYRQLVRLYVSISHFNYNSIIEKSLSPV